MATVVTYCTYNHSTETPEMGIHREFCTRDHSRDLPFHGRQVLLAKQPVIKAVEHEWTQLTPGYSRVPHCVLPLVILQCSTLIVQFTNFNVGSVVSIHNLTQGLQEFTFFPKLSLLLLLLLLKQWTANRWHRQHRRCFIICKQNAHRNVSAWLKCAAVALGVC